MRTDANNKTSDSYDYRGGYSRITGIDHDYSNEIKGAWLRIPMIEKLGPLSFRLKERIHKLENRVATEENGREKNRLIERVEAYKKELEDAQIKREAEIADMRECKIRPYKLRSQGKPTSEQEKKYSVFLDRQTRAINDALDSFPSEQGPEQEQALDELHLLCTKAYMIVYAGGDLVDGLAGNRIWRNLDKRDRQKS